jgi:hypothetical protein
MAGIKITNFLGIAPKLSPELIGAQFAQTAVNLNPYSGDLLPYRTSKEVDNTNRGAGVKTIYPMRDPNNATVNKWLSWTSDVDIAVPTTLDEEEQRIYYTGDGVPKVTDYSLAVSGAGPYPVSAGNYDLGLPLPTTKPSASATAFSEKTTSTVARDGNGVATVVTSVAHGLEVGSRVNISQLTYRTGTYARTASTVTVTLNSHGYETGAQLFMSFEPWQTGTISNQNGLVQSNTYAITNTGTNTFTFEDPNNNGNTAAGTYDVYVGLYDFNVVNAEIVTVPDSTTFTVASAGPKTSTITATTGKVNLAGTVQSRKYVYTWITPWGEESIPSEPSDAVYVREGQTVTVSGLPTAKPSGNNFIRGFRLYRTVVSASQGTQYFLLKTVYFTNAMTFAARTSNVVTAKFQHPHNLVVGSKIKITGTAFGGTPDTSFNVTDGTVVSAPDKYTITYNAAGSDKANTATSAGTLFWDVTEPGKTTYRYYESSTFTDDFKVSGLVFILDSLYADAPDGNMQGLTMAHNNILVGFVQNEVCFSDPGRPWSWPLRYRIVVEHKIVAVTAVGGAIFVLTTEYPYRIYGDNPAQMAATRFDIPMPCTSKRGVVNMGYGVLYPTYGGIALIGSDTGAVLATKSIHDRDTWTEACDPSTAVAKFFNNKYFMSHSTGSMLFERDDQIGGIMVTTPTKFNAAYYDARYDKFYYATADGGELYEWDAVGQPLLPTEWKSKVFINKEYTNIGAARVVADFSADQASFDAIVAFNAVVVTHNTEMWSLSADLGTLNGQLSYTDPVTTAYTIVDNSIGLSLVNGDVRTQYTLEVVGSYEISFRLWANKVLVADVVISDSEIFRLPTGYKSDTFEVAVSGSARIRAIHLADTPQGLVNV